jgi:hypothetical protein
MTRLRWSPMASFCNSLNPELAWGLIRYVRTFGMDSGAKVKNSHTKKGGDEKQEAGQERFLRITHSVLPSNTFSTVAEGEYV